MPLMEQVLYRFGPFLLDPTERQISRDGVPLTLTPKVFDTLLCLVRNCGHVLTKDELLAEIWPDTFVEEVNLAVNISTLRKAFGERANAGRYIATVPGLGYRFVAQVQEIPAKDESNGAASQLSGSGVRQSDVESISETGGAARIEPAAFDPYSGRILKAAARFVFALLAVAAIAAFVWLVQGREELSAARHPSIAVLPFVDLSPDKAHEYFADGLTEELIDGLGKVPNLNVVARSSAFQFKGKNEDLRSVGRRLGVSNVLEGSVSVQGNRVRIMAELIKTDDGFQIWSETYDRNLDDIFAVQDEIATATTTALQVKLLNAAATTVSTGLRTNTLAYQAYLQAQSFFGSDSDRASLEKTLAYVDEAIKSDANFAPAWALRSRVLSAMAAYALTDKREGYRQAREAAVRAIALAPNQAGGYLALGWVQMDYDWDWNQAEASLKKAAELEPGSVEVLRCQSSIDLIMGRRDEALDLYKKVVALDPLHARFYAQLGYRFYFAGQYEEAKAALQKALELNPQKEQDHLIRAQILLAQGRPKSALTEVEQESGTVWRSFGEALAYHALGSSNASDAALEKFIAENSADAPYQIAQIYAYRGEVDKAFEWLDIAYERHDVGLTCIKFDPLLAGLRQDHRYATLLKKLRLPQAA
jgi:TolB-like protein/DNA-binding winged helix-turn-helix (wHTH) protein/Tfp pilus assembly protein PilF